MEVMWNAVFYDVITEYSTSWRKRKLWFAHQKIGIPGSVRDFVKETECLPSELVSSDTIFGAFGLLQYCCYCC